MHNLIRISLGVTLLGLLVSSNSVAQIAETPKTNRYEAVFTSFEVNDFGKVVERIRLTDSNIEYIYADYSHQDRQCREFVGRSHHCGRILTGYASLISPGTHTDSVGIRARFIKRLIDELLDLKPFDLKESAQRFRPSPFAARFRLFEYGTESKVLKSIDIRDYEYNPWAHNKSVYRIFDFMRRMKAYVTFDPDIWNRGEIEALINNEPEPDTPYREVIRMASLIDIWQSNDRHALPELEKALPNEPNSEIKQYMSEMIKAWKSK